MLPNTSSGSGPYSVIATPQFRLDWNRAVAGGLINRELAAGLLELVRELLAANPYRHPLFPSAGEPVDMRWFDLYGGRRNPRVEIWYSIVEDDRLVHLVAVAAIHSGQQ